jgi:hypothetical protein
MQDQPGQTWDEPRSKPGSNPLGIVGFILAFCISPLGLLLSLIALAWRPRGFAVAGVIIGLIGSVIWGVFGTSAWIARHGFFLATEYVEVRSAVERYSAAHNGELPADLATAGVVGDAAKDPWGKEYRFEVAADGKSWTLTSASYDGRFGTADDAVFTPAMDQREIGEVIQRMMRGHFDPNAPAPAPPATAPAPAESKPAEKPAESPVPETKKPG